MEGSFGYKEEDRQSRLLRRFMFLSGGYPETTPVKLLGIMQSAKGVKMDYTVTSKLVIKSGLSQDNKKFGTTGT